jgi:hypothetical protein
VAHAAHSSRFAASTIRPANRLGASAPTANARSCRLAASLSCTICQFRIDDGLVLAGVGYTLVNDVASIDPVLEHQVEGAAGEPFTAGLCGVQ